MWFLHVRALIVLGLSAVIATPTRQGTGERQWLAKRNDANWNSGGGPRPEDTFMRLPHQQARERANLDYWNCLEDYFDPEWREWERQQMRDFRVSGGSSREVSWAEHHENCVDDAIYGTHTQGVAGPDGPYVLEAPRGLEELKRLRQARGIAPRPPRSSFADRLDPDEVDLVRYILRERQRREQPSAEDDRSNEFRLQDLVRQGGAQFMQLQQPGIPTKLPPGRAPAGFGLGPR